MKQIWFEKEGRKMKRELEADDNKPEKWRESRGKPLEKKTKCLNEEEKCVKERKMKNERRKKNVKQEEKK